VSGSGVRVLIGRGGICASIEGAADVNLRIPATAASIASGATSRWRFGDETSDSGDGPPAGLFSEATCCETRAAREGSGSVMIFGVEAGVVDV
jgi:hypothetical protein